MNLKYLRSTEVSWFVAKFYALIKHGSFNRPNSYRHFSNVMQCHEVQFNTRITSLFHRQRSETTNDIELEIRTGDTENGLILLVHKSATVEGDFLAMALVNGEIEVSYNLGRQSEENPFTLRSGVRVDDGEWHQVRFNR